MPHIHHLALLAAALIFTGCKTETGNVSSNTPPIASASWKSSGDLQDVVTLDASASHDDDGDALYYQWSIASKPAGSSASLPSSTTNPVISFIPDVAGEYQIELVVFDGEVQSNTFSGNFIAVDLIDLSVAPDYTVYRGGEASAELLWVIEKNGSVVLKRDATNSLNYRYFSLLTDDEMRIWLEDASGLTVSDTVSFTVGETYNYGLSVDTAYQLSRSGTIGDQLLWVIEEDGQTVLERGASGELGYTYPEHISGSRYRVWLNEYIDGAYTRVSNIVEYEVDGNLLYELAIDQNYLVVRNGNTGEPALWQIVEDSSTTSYQDASSALYWVDYTPSDSSQYTVTLVTGDGSHTPLSNTVSYTYDTQPQSYTISFDGTTLTRNGDPSASVIWAIEENGRIKAEVNGKDSLTYSPGSLVSAGNEYRFWLKALIGGAYQRVSNIISHTP